MIHPELLEILCCPESHQPVSEAPEALVAEVNAAIRGGTARNRDGEPVGEEIEGGLVREDGACLYPVRNGIPIMLIGERLALPLADGADESAGATGEAGDSGAPAPAGSAEEVEEDGHPDHQQVEADSGA